MSDVSSNSVPEIFGSSWVRSAVKATRTAGVKRRRPPLPGQRSILLSARNDRGASVLLAFTRARGGISFWRSLAPEKSALEYVTTFPGPFSVRAVAHLLASGAARPAVASEFAQEAWVEGVEPMEGDLLKLAWCRLDGRLDPRAAAVLALSDGALADACERNGFEGPEGLLDLGGQIADANREWLGKHRADIDAEVDRRATAVGAGEEGRRELRAFVEECLATLGRLPRTDETAECWDGAGVAGRDLGMRELRRLRLHQRGRAGRFHVWVRFWGGAGCIGRGEFGSGVGWYWDVTNPDPRWIMDGLMGPCDSADEAWSDAACIAEQE